VAAGCIFEYERQTFAVVQTFQLSLVPADAQGNVLRQQAIASSYGSNVDDTINFDTMVDVPPQTASMAFTYTGRAYSSGRGNSDPTNFRFYPFDK
jgi:hypothetical protein